MPRPRSWIDVASSKTAAESGASGKHRGPLTVSNRAVEGSTPSKSCWSAFGSSSSKAPEGCDSFLRRV